MTIHSYGSNAVLIRLDGGITDDNLSSIKNVSTQAQKTYADRILDVIPAYDSIVIRYNVEEIGYEELSQFISSIDLHQQTSNSSRELSIPVCFHSSFALDQDRVVEICNKPIDEVRQLLLSRSYQVHMMGFLPGFAFMASVDDALDCPRLSSPRKSVPAGSVAITGKQTAIYPVDSPGGWNILGHCPVDMFNANRQEPSLLKAYDRVTYKPITLEEHRHIADEVSSGHYDYNQRIIS